MVCWTLQSSGLAHLVSVASHCTHTYVRRNTYVSHLIRCTVRRSSSDSSVFLCDLEEGQVNYVPDVNTMLAGKTVGTCRPVRVIRERSCDMCHLSEWRWWGLSSIAMVVCTYAMFASPTNASDIAPQAWYCEWRAYKHWHHLTGPGGFPQRWQPWRVASGLNHTLSKLQAWVRYVRTYIV